MSLLLCYSWNLTPDDLYSMYYSDYLLEFQNNSSFSLTQTASTAVVGRSSIPQKEQKSSFETEKITGVLLFNLQEAIHIFISYFWLIPDPLRISSAMSLRRFWRDCFDELMWNVCGIFGNSFTVILAIWTDGKNNMTLWRVFEFPFKIKCFIINEHNMLHWITCMTKAPQLVASFWKVWVIFPGCHLMLTQSSFPSLFRRILKYSL